MKMLLLKPLGGFSVVEAEDLDDYYQRLECNLIDAIDANVKGYPITIICDDEGLLKETRFQASFSMMKMMENMSAV